MVDVRNNTKISNSGLMHSSKVLLYHETRVKASLLALPSEAVQKHAERDDSTMKE